MKKYVLSAMLIAMMVCLLAVPGHIEAAPDVSVKVDGQYVSFPDQKPYIDSANRTMVPVRAPMEKMGCTVDWNDKTKQAIIAKGDQLAVFTIGKNTYTVNGQRKTMDTKAVITNSRTAFPIRFAAEAMGATVDWDANTYTVLISTGQVEPPATAQKIEGTPFYQATPEQIQACKNAKMPSFTSKDFSQTSQAGKDAAFELWDFVFHNLPYKFYTDKSLVYMAQGEPVFRGYIDMGNGLQMVDLMFGSNLVAIMNVDPRERLELLEW
jgi:hypothetical protein